MVNLIDHEVDILFRLFIEGFFNPNHSALPKMRDLEEILLLLRKDLTALKKEVKNMIKINNNSVIRLINSCASEGFFGENILKLNVFIDYIPILCPTVLSYFHHRSNDIISQYRKRRDSEKGTVAFSNQFTIMTSHIHIGL